MISTTEGYRYTISDTAMDGNIRDSNYYETIRRKWKYESEERKRRLKMKKDPNELRKKANNKSTRPKWLDRK